MKKKSTSQLQIRKSTISNLKMKGLHGGEQNSVGCPPTQSDSIKYACCQGSLKPTCGAHNTCVISCGEDTCVTCESCVISCFTDCGCLTNLPEVGCR